MTNVKTQPAPRHILAATGAALVAAAVVLVVAVLPAEYGIDPLGTGRLLGLTALSGTVADNAAPATMEAEGTRTGPATIHTDLFEVELRPFEGVEYKYRIEQGGSLVYSWQATAKVGYDFHGEADGAPPRSAESYQKGEAAEASGGFIAAKPGIHGWFWENLGVTRVRVTLRTSGFYSASTEYRDGERIERTFPNR
jgi:hypothetical protein